MSLCEIQEATRNVFLVKNPVGASSWNQSSIKRLQSAPVSFEGISHVCMFGVKDPRSRRALRRPVRYLTTSPHLLKFVVRKCPNKHVHGPVKGLTNACRSSSRWHTRAWAQAVIPGVESDVVRRHEAHPAEDVEMASQTRASHPFNIQAPQMKTAMTWTSQRPGRADSVRRSSMRSFHDSLFGLVSVALKGHAPLQGCLATGN